MWDAEKFFENNDLLLYGDNSPLLYVRDTHLYEPDTLRKKLVGQVAPIKKNETGLFNWNHHDGMLNFVWKFL